MKIVAFATLHYGLDYAAASIRSVIDEVDVLCCIYSPTPSFLHNTDMPNPDSAENLFEVAQRAAGGKLHWYTARRGQFRTEGQHCDYVFELEPDADAYVRLDVDEIWTEGLLTKAVQFGVEQNAARVRVNWYHYWRSFRRAIVDDKSPADRIQLPALDKSLDLTYTGHERIHHMGYAQNTKIVEYKQYISSHAGEWRWQDNWYDNIYLTNRQYDCHPVARGLWTPVDVDPYALGMPDWMRQHPYAELEVTP